MVITDDSNQGNTGGHQRRQRERRPSASAANISQSREELQQMFIDALKRLWRNIKQWAHYVMVDLGGNQAMERTVQWCVRNPNTALIIIAAAIVMVLPGLILFAFGLSTILMTFTGFLVLEGTLLTLLSMMLVGCLATLAIVFVFFIGFAVAAYFGFAHIYDLVGGAERYRTALANYLQKERRRWETQNNNSSNGGTVRAVQSVGAAQDAANESSE